jgi:hypothetical protein
MNVVCPNCGVEFAEHRETAYFCETCGWLTQVDGKWVPCPEPARPAEPGPQPIEPIVPVPPEPGRGMEPENDDDATPTPNPARLNSNVRSYLGGLVTVTEEEDEETGQ